jgi:hypothetical protein
VAIRERSPHHLPIVLLHTSLLSSLVRSATFYKYDSFKLHFNFYGSPNFYGSLKLYSVFEAAQVLGQFKAAT